MNDLTRSAAAALCAAAIWLLPAAGQEPAVSMKELVAELTGLLGVDRGFRADARPRTGAAIEREADGAYVPGKVLVKWRVGS